MVNIKNTSWSDQYFLSRSFVCHFFFSPDGFFLSLRSNNFWPTSLRDIFLDESFFSCFNVFSFLLSRQGGYAYCGFPLGCFFFLFLKLLVHFFVILIKLIYNFTVFNRLIMLIEIIFRLIFLIVIYCVLNIDF